MSGSVSLAPTNDRHDADRLHRFAVLSRIEILHILLEHYCDSQCNKNAGSARRLHRRQPVARSQDLLSPSDTSSGGLPSSDRLHTLSRRIRRPPSDVPRQRQSWQGPPAGRAGPPAGRAGSRIQGAMPAAAATGRKVLRIRSMMQACTVVSTHTSSTTTHFTSGTPSGEI
jgi:hypothetical protein